MSDYSAEQTDAILRGVLFECWRRLLQRGGLTYRGLTWLRAQLDPHTGVFLPAPDVVDMALLVDMALAEELGVPLADLPGREGIDCVPESWL